jgi:hypothetical protein
MTVMSTAAEFTRRRQETPVMPAGCWLPSWRRVMSVGSHPPVAGARVAPGYRDNGRLCERSNLRDDR